MECGVTRVAACKMTRLGFAAFVCSCAVINTDTSAGGCICVWSAAFGSARSGAPACQTRLCVAAAPKARATAMCAVAAPIHVCARIAQVMRNRVWRTQRSGPAWWYRGRCVHRCTRRSCCAVLAARAHATQHGCKCTIHPRSGSISDNSPEQSERALTVAAARTSGRCDRCPQTPP